ncbi:unnamed protein product [Tuber melanosporum]|uniref:(Perigord truffle) hypothetical protein n=1 Tax=Tuber melanosporum (strain Mel28) TaxID=656061 RepID=D5GIT3_TUBMM|nr:uncharacterized protein GSTUM_00008665001 [Tuber melanosporum]CAZ84426.1 unnamed protein product [Tuber melanosporum]
MPSFPSLSRSLWWWCGKFCVAFGDRRRVSTVGGDTCGHPESRRESDGYWKC